MNLQNKNPRPKAKIFQKILFFICLSFTFLSHAGGGGESFTETNEYYNYRPQILSERAQNSVYRFQSMCADTYQAIYLGHCQAPLQHHTRYPQQIHSRHDHFRSACDPRLGMRCTEEQRRIDNLIRMQQMQRGRYSHSQSPCYSRAGCPSGSPLIINLASRNAWEVEDYAPIPYLDLSLNFYPKMEQRNPTYYRLPNFSDIGSGNRDSTFIPRPTYDNVHPAF